MPNAMTSARESAPQVTSGDARGWDAVTVRLQEERARVFAELRAYPPPIAGCDVQFNGLLERRDAIAAELARWDALRQAEAPDEAARRAFVEASAVLDETLKRSLLADA